MSDNKMSGAKVIAVLRSRVGAGEAIWGADPGADKDGAEAVRYVADMIAERDAQAKRIAELLEVLKLAQEIIGHPDDKASKFIAATIAKNTED